MARLRFLLVAAVLLWGLWSFGAELTRAWSAPPRPGALDDHPGAWRLSSPQAKELAGFLAAVDARLPAGRAVAVLARKLPGDQDFFLYMWQIYYLPRHDVVRARLPWAQEHAEYLVAYQTRIDSPRLELLFEHPQGALYRVRRP